MTLIITLDSFAPSPVLVRLVYKSIFTRLSESLCEDMISFTTVNFKFGFISVINDIRNWNSCFYNYTDRFDLVSHKAIVSNEFMSEFDRKIDLKTGANTSSPEFKLRLGEEILRWAMYMPKEADRMNIKFDQGGNLFLVRKRKISVC